MSINVDVYTSIAFTCSTGSEIMVKFDSYEFNLDTSGVLFGKKPQIKEQTI